MKLTKDLLNELIYTYNSVTSSKESELKNETERLAKKYNSLKNLKPSNPRVADLFKTVEANVLRWI